MAGDEGANAPEVIDDTAAVPSPSLDFVERVPPYYDAQERLDVVRSRLALALVGLLTMVIIGAFALVLTVRWTGLAMSDVRLLLEIVITPVVALVSAATGFYFGAQLTSGPRRTRR